MKNIMYVGKKGLDELKEEIGGGGSGGGLNNAKDAENGGIIEGLVNGNEGEINVASGDYAHAEGGCIGEWGEGVFNTASGVASHAEGVTSTSSGNYSHAEGNRTTASGEASHAEGYQTTASQYYSHAEGNGAIASSSCSHAEGEGSTASGYASHAEGAGNTASGDYSHAEGDVTSASGLSSHAEGRYTIANHGAQHVFGEFNISDPSTAAVSSRGTYVEIVGNGTSSNRSNARTLDWSGNEVLSGSINPKGGLILQSPDGSSFTIHVANDGTLSATKNA